MSPLYVFFLFVWFDSLRPMQHFFSYVGTSTKQRLMCLAQGNNTGMLEPANPRSRDKRSTAEPPFVSVKVVQTAKGNEL